MALALPGNGTQTAAGSETSSSEKSPMRSSSKITVRPFTPADTDSFFAAVRESVESLSYWLPWCTLDYSRQQAATWMAFCELVWQERSEFPLGIFATSSGKVMGATGINYLRPEYRLGNLGYWVGDPHRGQGIAYTAAWMAADIGFVDLGLTRLEVVAMVKNTASQRVAEKLGAVRECVARNRVYFQGAPADAVVYSLIPGDLARNPGRSLQPSGESAIG
jgi:ribosomal-protein-serine acetyltransferase